MDLAGEHPGVGNLLPGRPRSILKIAPATGPFRPFRPSMLALAPGSRSRISRDERFRARARAGGAEEPGWTSPRPACVTNSSRSRLGETARSSLRQAARNSSSWSASSSPSRAANASSPRPYGSATASWLPRRRTDPIAMTAGVSRARISLSTRSSWPPCRSILFTKIRVGMRSRRSVRMSTRVWACTPSTAEMTRTAPSRTLSTRSTSAMKSGWPGVSIRLTPGRRP